MISRGVSGAVSRRANKTVTSIPREDSTRSAEEPSEFTDCSRLRKETFTFRPQHPRFSIGKLGREKMASTTAVKWMVLALALGASPREARASKSGPHFGRELEILSRYRAPGEVFDGGAAEIAAHDPETGRLFVINGATHPIDVLPNEERGDMNPCGDGYSVIKNSWGWPRPTTATVSSAMSRFVVMVGGWSPFRGWTNPR
jgi:hypothetical protein